jgi:two-component sensor histidine kinase
VANKEAELKTENVRLRRLLEQAGIDAAASDVTSRLQQALIAELHHRVRNLLAMVSAIADQTLRVAPSQEAAREAIQNRIRSLARSFDILSQSGMEAAPLRAVVESAVAPYNETNRITVAVPTVTVATSSALSMALVFNELCTNAVKYGALSRDGGSVEVSGTVDDSVLTVVWTETGGPPVKPPTARGFGTRMIASIIPEAQIGLDFQPSGLVCRIQAPVTSLDYPSN